jgi:hypothetical protein
LICSATTDSVSWAKRKVTGKKGEFLLKQKDANIQLPRKEGDVPSAQKIRICVDTGRRRNLRDKTIIILLCALAVIYGVFLYCDIAAYAVEFSPDVKYTGILLCLAVSVCVWKHPSRKLDATLQSAALACAVAADYFLLFTSHFTVGIAIFCGAHLTALIRYRRRWFIPGAILTVAGLCAWLFLYESGQSQIALTVMAAIYGVLILSVTVGTFRAKQNRINNILSRTGMILFVLCDLNVAVFNLLPSDGSLYAAASVLMWAFYLPAQTLLALSAYRFSSREV